MSAQDDLGVVRAIAEASRSNGAAPADRKANHYRTANEGRALSQATVLYDESITLLDERTLAILEQRRKTATIRRRGWLIRRMLLAADLVGLIGAFGIAQWLASVYETGMATHVQIAFFVATMPLWVMLARSYGLYDRDEERTDHSTIDETVAVFHVVTTGAWLLFIAAAATGLLRIHVVMLVTFWIAAILLIVLARGIARSLSRRRITYQQNAVIAGAGDVGQSIAHKLLQHPEYGINLVGFVDVEPKERREDLENLTILGPPERLPAIVRMFDIERVIVAFSKSSHADMLDLIRRLSDLDVQVDIVPRFFDLLTTGASIHTVEGVPLLGLARPHLARTSQLFKRTFDFVLASSALVVLSPLFAVLALLIKTGSRGPVFFRQVRMGSNERTFAIYKFRTMEADADARKAELVGLNMHARNGGDPRMFKIPDDPRVTRIGRFMRRWSIDELPQLLNVVRGEMSLVGPRPLILDEDQHVKEWARQRLNIKPGITGPWQVLGRNEIPFEEMVKLDYLYVTGWSVFNDIKLILQTVPALVRTSGAY
jgi:exopolysaccharide biosynthesis polyprenyl glycosylphosphotransferase